jgi:aspartyl-tRNA(Asn)/glutamyl-tRNA(Gln) amidotransferase subunit A
LISAVDYLHAQRLRRELCARMEQVMNGFDVLILPTAATAATLRGSPRGEHRQGEDPMAALIWRTGPFNLTGQPALSVPCGFTSTGLPMGLQVVGRPFEDNVVLRVGHAYEQATEWHTRRPRLS